MTLLVPALPPAVIRLLDDQLSVARVSQLLAAGLSRQFVRAQVLARRWQRYGDHCVVAHNFLPTRPQRMWLAVLEPAPPVCLAGLTSLETGGLRFFGRELQDIHILVRRGSTSGRAAGVRVHESRRFRAGDIDRAAPIPRTTMPRSALDAAAWQPSIRYACALLAAVVQQGLCRPDELQDELGRVGRIRHKRHLRLAVLDIAGGAHALGEIDVAALCRRFDLCPPDRQRVRKDRNGRTRFLDCEWVLPDGSIVVLEVDGSHHMTVEHWEADLKRERDVVISGRRVLRATASEARYDQAELARDLAAIGVPRLL